MNRFAKQYGPWAVVAGASEGIGAAFARQLARRGLNLLLIARRADPLARLARQLRERPGEEGCVEILQVPLDLARADLTAEIEERTRALDVGLLVYNAALSRIQPFLDQSLEQLLIGLDVNCRGPLALAHLFGRRLAARGRGGIVLMSSLAGFQGAPLISASAASRAFNLVLAEGLADELRRHGVDVLTCCAGATRTPGYLRSQATGTGGLSAPPMDPEQVAQEALDGLGRQALVIPGRTNRLASQVLRRMLPRQVAVRIMERATRSLFSAAGSREGEPW